MGTFSRRALAALLAATALAGCASSELTVTERRALQARRWDGVPVEVLFRAVKNVMQDDGYIIKIQDASVGTVVGIQERTDKASAFWAQYEKVTEEKFPVGETLEVAVQIDRVKDNKAEVRLTMVRLDPHALGGERGVELRDPAVYGHFFKKLKAEADRRR